MQMNNPVAIICDGVFAFMRIIALLRLTHSPDLVLYVSWHARTVWGRSGTVGTVWGRFGDGAVLVQKRWYSAVFGVQK